MNKGNLIVLMALLTLSPTFLHSNMEGKSGARPHEPFHSFDRKAPRSLGLQNGTFKAKLNGVEISYTIAGSGPAIFIQGVGWGPDSRLYQNTLKMLEAQFTLIYIDPRGTGNVEPIADLTKLSSDLMADDLEALRQHLNINRIALIGHAHGGLVAMKYALKYPSRLSRLILVSCVMLPDLEENIRAVTENFQRHPRRKDPHWEEAVARFKNEYNANTIEAMRKNLELTGILYFYSYAAQRTKYENSIKESRLSISNYSAFVQNELLKYHINDQESSLAVPSLLIFGLYDPYFIRSSVRRLHWSIRNSKLEIFEFSGHFPWIEEPNHFVEVVKAFVSPPAPVVKEGAK